MLEIFHFPNYSYKRSRTGLEDENGVPLSSGGSEVYKEPEDYFVVKEASRSP